MEFITKAVLSGLIIAVVSTLSRRVPLFGAIVASLPLTSMLAMIWLYGDTKDVEKVASLSMSIFWVVVPSLVFFVAMAYALRKGLGFYPAMLTSSATMVGAYWAYIRVLTAVGVKF